MKRKIFVLVPALGIGGQEKQAILLVEQLKKVADCHIVIFFEAEPHYDTEADVLNLSLPPLCCKIGKIIQQIRRAARLSRLKKQYEIDLVISFGDTANLTNILSGDAGERIVSLRTSWSAEYSVIKKFVYRKSDRILCQTEAMKEMLFRNYKDVQEKTEVFYNIFDINDIEEKSQEKCDLEDEGEFIIIAVGRLDKLKGYQHLIRAFSTVVWAYEKVKLLIVGGGDEYKNLEHLAKSLKIHEYVIFTGSVRNPYKYMKNADLFVLSSCVEGFPNVLVEAMACGLPVIATDCETGPREILSATYKRMDTVSGIEYADYGVLVPAFRGDDIPEPEKDKLLAAAMLELIQNSEKRAHYMEMAKKRAKVFFTSDAESKIEEIFLK